MHPDLPTALRTFVRRYRLFLPEDRLLVAVSGGLDSTVLAQLLADEGYATGLVHCNYGLRGADSDGDEVSVRALAARLGVPVYARRFDLGSPDEAGESVQMRARSLRYKHFEEILEEYNYDHVVTAHHLDDSLETLLINLVRGTGIAGLAGIPPVNYPAVRPLLESTREQILAYATARGLTWREDASNAGEAYLRNRVRHRLTPVLRELGLTTENLGRTLARLRAERQLTQRGLQHLEDLSCRQSGDHLLVDRALLEREAPGVAELVLRRIGGHGGFTNEQFRQMLTVGGRPTLRGTAGVVHISPTQFVFAPLPEDVSSREFTISELPATVETETWTYHLREVERPARLTDSAVLYFRSSPLPLHLRPRRTGDRFRPFGMDGRSKKVKNFLIDEKFTAREKAATYLLCAADGRIMAVGHHRGSEEFRVRPEDRRVLLLSAERRKPE